MYCQARTTGEEQPLLSQELMILNDRACGNGVGQDAFLLCVINKGLFHVGLELAMTVVA